MPAAARKSADAASAAVEAGAAPATEAGPSAPVAEAAPVEAAAEEEFRPPVTVVFLGHAQSSVAGVGLVEPGEQYLVPAALAAELVRGGLFALTESA
jgi:hypothetical protein